jgi:hypothetical protein
MSNLEVTKTCSCIFDVTRELLADPSRPAAGRGARSTP